jgi:malonate-semialdehyde dehydrogenase (acetylating) / methylmalonate-semialdehyde dehydrogenase
MQQLSHIVDGIRLAVTVSGSPAYKVHNPASGDLVCSFDPAGSSELDAVTVSASSAFKTWSRTTWKARASILFTFRHLCLTKYKDELVSLITLENGKHRTDATASLLKGLEVVEYAVSPSLGSGQIQEVSSGIYCQDRRDPVGVVLSICPFNFPAMVPLWTVPILLVSGNVVIVKPSEKVPFTITRLCEIMIEAGLPKGVLSVLHGGADLVNKLIIHPTVSAVTFVGSTPIARKVYELATSHSKRAICLGGAKNHLVVLPDADFEQSSTDILNSFAGSAGQRCMAASVLVLCGEGAEGVLEVLIEKAKKIQPGQKNPNEIGPLIDKSAQDRVAQYIHASESKFGGRVLLDGRGWQQKGVGFWMGPTIIDHGSIDTCSDPILSEEVFGPVISVVRCASLEAAVGVINRSEFGNAACVYTRSGPCADFFTRSVNVGMIGVNIGVPVPREPFSFGGTKGSKFGIGDITGDGLLEFCTIRRKITTKWGAPKEGDFVSRNFTG